MIGSVSPTQKKRQNELEGASLQCHAHARCKESVKTCLSMCRAHSSSTRPLQRERQDVSTKILGPRKGLGDMVKPWVGIGRAGEWRRIASGWLTMR